MTFQEVLNKIESRADHPAREASFQRFTEAAAQQRLEIDPDTVILVAGTNGKGTTAKFLEALYTANGHKTALYTSPHLIETTERIRINNRDLTEREFVDAFEKIEHLHAQHQLSHFETLTLMMMETFFNRADPPTRAIIEVGVGGLWDPTRFIPHATTVITKLGLDHQAVLGNSIQEIANHKFGAIAPGNLVIHAPWPDGIHAPDANCIEAPVLPYRIERTNDEPRWLLDNSIPLKLQGLRAVENASIAIKVLEARREPINPQALANTNWHGRMERFDYQNKRVYLSGDHNEQGLHSLIEILNHYEYRKLKIIFAAGKNKDAGQLQRLLKRHLPNAEIITTRTPFRPSETKVDYVDPIDALKSATETGDPQDLIVATGSLYLVGCLRSHLVT